MEQAGADQQRPQEQVALVNSDHGHAVQNLDNIDHPHHIDHAHHVEQVDPGDHVDRAHHDNI